MRVDHERGPFTSTRPFFLSIPLVRLSLPRCLGLLLFSLVRPSLHHATSHAPPSSAGHNSPHDLIDKGATGPFLSTSDSVRAHTHAMAPTLPMRQVCVAPPPLLPAPATANTHKHAIGNALGLGLSLTTPCFLHYYRVLTAHCPRVAAATVCLLHAEAPLAKWACSAMSASFFLYCESRTTSAVASLEWSVV